MTPRGGKRCGDFAATDNSTGRCNQAVAPGVRGFKQYAPPGVRSFSLFNSLTESTGMFISFDGADGVGKTTQIRLLVEWLAAEGHDTLVCRDPGSTDIGERIRELLLAEHEPAMSRRAEMLLYMAARAQLVDQVLTPAAAAGKTVISDRFLLANIVYQGHAGGVPLEAVRAVGEIAVAGLLPDLVLLLDMPPEVALARIGRELDRMERQGLEFRKRLRAGFLAEAQRDPQRIAVIDASQTVEQVHAEIRRVVTERLLLIDA